MSELETLDPAALDAIVGGEGAPNVTTVTTPRMSTSTQRTDYAFCADTVRQSCQQANPGFLGFGTNQQGAAQCTLQNLAPTCGTPPAPSGP